MRNGFRRPCAAAIVIAMAACSSNYMPRSRGRVATSIQDGDQVYVRDGRVYKNGWLGSGLSEAVAGNPRAVAAAGVYHDRLSIGMIGVVVGGAVTVGGSLLLAGANGSTTTNQFAGSFVAVIAGLAVAAVGSLYITSAEPYRWDAINLFNDDADAPMPLAPPGYAPMKTSMRMR